jgi:hypothetical protein
MCPPHKDSVRGEIIESGFIIQPKAGSDDSIVTYISQIDLKGIPSSVVNLVGERQPLVIAAVRKALTGSRTLVL